MKTRPRTLTVLSIVFMLLAFALPIQVMMIYGHGLSELPAVFAKLTILNLLVMVGLVTCAVAMWNASPRTLHLVTGVTGLVAVNNFFVGYYATDFSPTIATLATIGFAFLSLPLFEERLVWLFKHPEQRWWLRAERHRVSVPIIIEGTRLTSLKTETFDLSESGLFVPMTRELGVGDWIHVRMTFGALAQVRCQGRVVRRHEARGNYPSGVGIQFMDLSWRQRRELRRHLDRGAEA